MISDSEMQTLDKTIMALAKKSLSNVGFVAPPMFSLALRLPIITMLIDTDSNVLAQLARHFDSIRKLVKFVAHEFLIH